MSRTDYERLKFQDDDPLSPPDSDEESLHDGESSGLRVPVIAGEPRPMHRPISPALVIPEAEAGPLQKSIEKNKTVAWRDLPRKQQLFVITMARLSEPLVQTSLQSYMFYQLKWFDPSLPDSVISSQAGILHASFTAAQLLTALLWGRVADSSYAGRKTVLLIGLCGTSISCIGFGFSQSFFQALFFRVLGGITNGNVGVMRTMISEIIREKKYQSRAFLILPMTFNIGVIIGPILGGILSDPAGSYPDLFGHIAFFIKYPYATPNLLSAVFLASAALAVWLGLEETLDSLRDSPPDLGRRVGSLLATFFRRIFSLRTSSGSDDHASVRYAPLPSHARDSSITSVEMSPVTPTPTTPKKTKAGPRYTQRLSFRRIFTTNVSWTLMAHFFLAFHVGTYNSLWFVFLSTPVYDPSGSQPKPHLPFRFTGGLGLPPREVGMAMAILGVLGILLQILFYPPVSSRLGTLRSYRLFLLCFPLSYFLIPYLSVVPSTSPPPHAKSGIVVWVTICAVLFVQVLGRTFALPGQTILVNNCTPHPSVLGTLHGLGQSVSSAARTVGPMVGGVVYGVGLNHGIVGAVFWGLSAVAICGVVVSWFLKEGDGHEIWLEGDEEDEPEEVAPNHQVAGNRGPA